MKNQLFLLLLFIATMPVVEATEMPTEAITVTVKNIKFERAGEVLVFVFYRQGFPKQHNEAIATFIQPVTGDELLVEIEVPRDQTFALKVLHDENMDGMVSKNWTGILPYDGLGFSNGARIRFSAPDFDDAMISYSSTLEPVINLQYF